MLMFLALMGAAWSWTICGYFYFRAEANSGMAEIVFMAAAIALPVAAFGYIMGKLLSIHPENTPLAEDIKRVMFQAGYLALMITPGAVLFGGQWVIFLVPAVFLWLFYLVVQIG